MRRLIILIIFVLSLLCICQGQSTTVTLQVTDTPDNQSWNNGTWHTEILPLQGTIATNVFKIAGTTTPVPNIIQNGSLNGTGGATVILTPNSSITPIGTLWTFTVCPQATAPCYSQNIFILGTTQNVTITPPSVRVNSKPSFIASAYTDTEAIGGVGTLYYNLIAGALKVCTNAVNPCQGSGWSTIAGGGGGTPGGTPTQLQYDNSGSFGGVSGTSVGGGNITMTGNLTTPQVNNAGSSISLASTGYTLNDPFGNSLTTTATDILLQYENGASGNGVLTLGNIGVLGASVILTDGNGNGLILDSNQSSFGVINLTNAAEQSGFINSTGNLSYVYGDTLQLGVNPNTALISNVSPGIQISSAAGILFIPGSQPIALQGFGTGCISVTSGVLGTTSCGSGLSGLTTNGVLYATSPTAVTSLIPPSVNGPYVCGYTVTSSTSVTPSCNFPGVNVDSGNPASLNCATDRETYLPWTTGGALGLPLATGNCASNLAFVVNNKQVSTSLVITPVSPNTINGGASLTLPPNVASFVYQDSGNNWQAIPYLTLSYVPTGGWCPVTGCTYTGTITLPASTISTVPLIISAGATPSASTSGWVWMGSTGLFYNISGTVVGPLGSVPANIVIGPASLTTNIPVIGAGSDTVIAGFTDTPGTSTVGHLVAYTATNVIGNCTLLPCNNTIGVFTASGSWTNSGETSVVLDTTQSPVFMDYVCASNATASDAHDNGSSACTTTQVGFVKTSATSVTSATIFVQIAPPSTGGGGGGVSSVTGTAPIVSSGGTTPAISCATCAISVGTPPGTGVAIYNGTSQTISGSGALEFNGAILFVGTAGGSSGLVCIINGPGSSQQCLTSDPAAGHTLIPGTGTLAVGASSPIALNTSTGIISCPTCLTTAGVPLNDVTSPTGAIATIANGNNALTISSAQTTNSQTAVSIIEATAATGTTDQQFLVSTLTASTSIVQVLTQGSVTGTTSIPVLQINSTYNNASQAGSMLVLNFTNTASAATASFITLNGGSSAATLEFNIDRVGDIQTNGTISGVSNASTLEICGGPATGCSTSFSGQLGGVQITGANNTSSNSLAKAGIAVISGGFLTNATPNAAALEGAIQIQASYLKGTAIAALGDIVCFSGTTVQYTVTDCPTTPGTNVIGIADTTANPVGVVVAGQALVSLDAALTNLGDNVCVSSTTAGKGHDNGTTACTLGTAIGVIIADSGTINIVTAGSITATAMSTTLVEVQLHIAQ